jgi:hypothetical protein
LDNERRYDNAGVGSAITAATQQLEAAVAGQNIYDLDAVGIQEKVYEFNEQLRAIVDEVNSDPSLSAGQKSAQSAMRISRAVAEFKKETEARFTEEKRTQICR